MSENSTSQNQSASNPVQNPAPNTNSQPRQNKPRQNRRGYGNRRNNTERSVGVNEKGKTGERNGSSGSQTKKSQLSKAAEPFVPKSMKPSPEMGSSGERQSGQTGGQALPKDESGQAPKQGNNRGNNSKRPPHRRNNNRRNNNNGSENGKGGAPAGGKESSEKKPEGNSTPQPKNNKNKSRDRFSRGRTYKKPIHIPRGRDSSTIADLKERLEYELFYQTYTCDICFEKIKHHQKIYSCPSCYGVLHLNCMTQWVFRSLEDSLRQQIPKNVNTPIKLLQFFADRGFQSIESKCPRCREALKFPTKPSGCFCGVNHEHINAFEESNPANGSFDSLTPHSCGYPCNRVMNSHCTHPCTLLCHAGPCPPCTISVTKPCACGKEEITTQCCNSHNELHCRNVCGKLLACKEHYCQRVCHSGECGKCTYQIDVSCYCGKEHKMVACGDINYQLRSRYPEDPRLLKKYVPPEPDTKGMLVLLNGHEVEDQVQDHVIDKSIYANMSFEGLEDLSDDDEEESTNEVTKEEEESTNEAVKEEEPAPEYHLKTFKEAGVGGYSCHQICNKILECQYHRCQRECHPGDCGKCERILPPGSHCPCGRCLNSELAPHRQLCVEPVPTCDHVCDKLLPCGVHHCKQKCHLGPCPTCTEPVQIKCRCKYYKKDIPCWAANHLTPPPDVSPELVAKLTAPYLCAHVCGNPLNCKKHLCTTVCCPYRGQKPKGEAHMCNQVCDKLLNCGIHHCTQTCHNGPCMPCGHIYMEPLVCPCGRTVIPPPYRCGSKDIECKYPCTKTCCNGHNGFPPHNCHEGPCPPCTALMDKLCVGQHQLIHNVPCWNEEITCNNICGRELKCGHICKRMCHKLPCDQDNNFDVVGCGQPCGKLRKYCFHTCQAPCHPGQPCPDVPCPCCIELRCPCGRRIEKEQCMIGGLQPDETRTQEEIEKIYAEMRDRQLECDEKCEIIMRNIRLATALQVGPALKQYDNDDEKRRAYEQELLVCPYSKSLLLFVATKPTFAEYLVQTCDKLAMTRTVGKEIELPYFYKKYEKNLRDLAAFYGIEITVTDQPQKIVAKLGPNPHRPELSLLDAFKHVDDLVQGTKIHPQQPSAEKATEKDFATLYIYDYKRDFENRNELLNFLDAVLPRGKYHIRRWLKPNGLLVTFLTVAIAQQCKEAIGMHNLHMHCEFWAERPIVDTYDDLDEEYGTKKKSVEIGGVKPKRLPSYGKKKEEEMPLYYNPWSILDTDSSEEEEEEEEEQ